MPLAKNLFRAFACLALVALVSQARGDEIVERDDLIYENRTFRDIPFTVVRINLDRTPLRLFWKDPEGKPYQNFHALRDELAARNEELLVATNAGIYAEDRTPLGLHVETGAELRPLNLHKGGKSNFALKPNGVFFVGESGASILTTEAYEAATPKPRLAVQSGPLLVIDGELHPKFEATSTSVHLRNGIGVVSPKEVVLVIANWPLNLHTFASFFRDELKCRNALYLDGTLSGLYAPAIERNGAGIDYVGILAVTRPSAKSAEAAGE